MEWSCARCRRVEKSGSAWRSHGPHLKGPADFFRPSEGRVCSTRRWRGGGSPLVLVGVCTEVNVENARAAYIAHPTPTARRADDQGCRARTVRCRRAGARAAASTTARCAAWLRRQVKLHAQAAVVLLGGGGGSSGESREGARRRTSGSCIGLRWGLVVDEELLAH
eukprot:scaffold40072_cov25-Tisochrysis_lutea.AAC.7